MAQSALIANLLDPPIEPEFADLDRFYEKTFGNGAGYHVSDQLTHDYVRNFKRSSTYALDWAGDKLLIATKDNALRLFDVERGDELMHWQGEWMSMQCDPSNPHIAAAVSWSGRFRVFDTRRSDNSQYDIDLKKTHAGMKEFLFLCWSPDSKYVAVNNRSDQVYLLDLRHANSLRVGHSMSMPHEVNQMVFSADGDSLWIGTGSSPGKIHVYPAPSLQKDQATSVVAHQYTTISLAADANGRHIASGGGDCLVTLWDPKHLVCTRTFGFATQAVTSLGFSRDGDLLAWGTGGSGSTGGEKNLTIVGADTGGLYYQQATSAPVQQVRWHPKRNVLAYTLNVAQLPDERDVRDDRNRMRGMSMRESAVVHLLTIPEAGLTQ